MPRPIMKALLRIACSLLLISASFDAAAADTIVRDLPPGLHVPADARPGPGFDIERATEAWLGLLSPEQRALSDAYFEGGYWLKLWSVVLGSVVLSVFYAVMRRAGQRWWVWTTGFAFGFTLLLDLIYPVFIAPLFNDYKPLPEGPVRDTVLSLARANEIPTDHLEWFD